MKNYRTGEHLIDIPKLNEDIYIYIMENDVGKIKIGKTKNIYKRYISLCGSNGQGNKIIRVYCSPATRLLTIENIMHEHFNKYRIQGTEWFNGVDFLEVVDYLQSLFLSDYYNVANDMRKRSGLNER